MNGAAPWLGLRGKRERGRKPRDRIGRGLELGLGAAGWFWESIVRMSVRGGAKASTCQGHKK